ncbi:MAG: hypothetical protein ABJA66_17935 [Actinomycetota bacterium]
MKLRFLFLLLATTVFSTFSFAQDKNIAIEISLKDLKILTTNKNVPVKIKITNKSEQILNTGDLGDLFLYFSKCRKVEMCYRQGDLLFGIVKIKSKTLKKDKSLEFESNLSDLIWIDELSSYRYDRKNFETIPAENIYFYAAIPTRKDVLPKGVRLPEDFLSNQIAVSLNSK